MHDAGEGAGGVLLGEDAADVGVGVAGVDDQRQAGRGARPRCGGAGSRPAPRRCRRCSGSRGRSRRCRRTSGARRARPAPRRVASGSSAACIGWVPAAQKTPGCASAMARTCGAWRSRVQIVTMRVTPAAAARATTASISPAKSGKSRWQWLSTRAGGGIGALAAGEGSGRVGPRLGGRRVDLQEGIEDHLGGVKVDRAGVARCARRAAAPARPRAGACAGVRAERGRSASASAVGDRRDRRRRRRRSARRASARPSRSRISA